MPAAQPSHTTCRPSRLAASPSHEHGTSKRPSTFPGPATRPREDKHPPSEARGTRLCIAIPADGWEGAAWVARPKLPRPTGRPAARTLAPKVACRKARAQRELARHLMVGILAAAQLQRTLGRALGSPKGKKGPSLRCNRGGRATSLAPQAGRAQVGVPLPIKIQTLPCPLKGPNSVGPACWLCYP